jgi:hypothetical protein
LLCSFSVHPISILPALLHCCRKETEAPHRVDFRKSDFVYKPNLSAQAMLLPLPPPPTKLDKPQVGGVAERRGAENAAPAIDNKVDAFGHITRPGVSISSVQRNRLEDTNIPRQCSFKQCKNSGRCCQLI